MTKNNGCNQSFTPFDLCHYPYLQWWDGCHHRKGLNFTVVSTKCCPQLEACYSHSKTYTSPIFIYPFDNFLRVN